MPTWTYAVVPITTVIPMGMIMVVVMIVVMVMIIIVRVMFMIVKPACEDRHVVTALVFSSGPAPSV